LTKNTKKRGPFKWFLLRDGKEIDYKFPSKQAETIYIRQCEGVWGGAPLDVEWAINTSLFKEVYGKANHANMDN
jgi:hypothetical protein